MKNTINKPFLKWAGGKSQLLDVIHNKYPDNIDSYCEPFVGAGAVLFDVLAYKKPNKVLINDINVELINTYIQIRDNVDDLIRQLYYIQEEYLKLEVDKRCEYYLSKRKEFNDLMTVNNNLQKAVLFIFINKTCFNGLYRVNKKGLFNTPFGKDLCKNKTICDINVLINSSKLLHNTTIRCGDFFNCIDFIKKDTFVYLDPPYRPLNITSSFNQYDNHLFNDDEQIRLSQFVKEIDRKGAKILLSNSDPKNVDIDDSFFDQLYDGFIVNRVYAKRMINSNGCKRGPISELLISNY